MAGSAMTARAAVSTPPDDHDRPALAVAIRPAPATQPRFDDELAAPRLHLVPPPEPTLPLERPPPRRFENDVDFFDPQPTSRSLLPDPHQWAAALVRAALETLSGRRPASQLRQWTSPAVLDAVRHTLRRCVYSQLGAMRSVHVCEPADGVAEVCAVVRWDTRCAALTARLEGLDGRWQCVALNLAPPRCGQEPAPARP